MVLTAYFVLSPVIGLFLSPSSADMECPKPGRADMPPQTWRRRRGVRTTRLRRPQQHLSSARPV